MPDRLMTSELAAALDALTPSQRRILPVIAGESAHDWLAALLLGLAAEVPGLERREVVAKMRDDMVLHDLYVDHLADVEAVDAAADWSHVPPPAPRTIAWHPWAVPDDVSDLDNGSVGT